MGIHTSVNAVEIKIDSDGVSVNGEHFTDKQVIDLIEYLTEAVFIRYLDMPPVHYRMIMTACKAMKAFMKKRGAEQ